MKPAEASEDAGQGRCTENRSTERDFSHVTVRARHNNIPTSEELWSLLRPTPARTEEVG